MNRLPKKKVISVRRSAVICFMLMAAAMIILAAQCAYQLGSHNFRNETAEFLSGRPTTEDPEAAGASTKLETIRNQMLVRILTVLVLAGGAFFFFLKKIVVPIHQMAEATRMMAAGRLDMTVPSSPRNEIGQIGEVINDLAVNLQEVLLHVWNHTSHSMELLSRINEKLMTGNSNGQPHRIEEDVEDVRQTIKEMRDLVQTFEYYDIQLDNGRILAAETSHGHWPSGDRPSGDLEDRSPRWDLENSK